jgi:NADH:ubiquinone oxidoreductase subunit 6 (subunit J)
MATEVVWWIFAALIVGTSLGVVISGSVIHSAIMLIVSMGGIGAMYILLTVEFLALVQLLIYGGAVTVLILLALMLTRQAGPGEKIQVNGVQAPFGALVGGLLMAILIGVAVSTTWPGQTEQPFPVAIETIGEKLFLDFGAPFVIASAVLLVALVGAIILARQEDAD